MLKKQRLNEKGLLSPAVCVNGDKLLKIEVEIDLYDESTKTEIYDNAADFLRDWNEDTLGKRKAVAWFELSDGGMHTLTYCINRFKIEITGWPLTAKEKKDLEFDGDFNNFYKFKSRLADELYFLNK